MILLFGTRATEALLTMVHFVCDYCGVAAPQRVIKRTNKFTLFFVLPLFPISTNYFVECTNCGGITALTKEQATHGLEWAAARERRIA